MKIWEHKPESHPITRFFVSAGAFLIGALVIRAIPEAIRYIKIERM
jgi:hypothetical protein